MIIVLVVFNISSVLLLLVLLKQLHFGALGINSSDPHNGNIKMCC